MEARECVVQVQLMFEFEKIKDVNVRDFWSPLCVCVNVHSGPILSIQDWSLLYQNLISLSFIHSMRSIVHFKQYDQLSSSV